MADLLYDVRKAYHIRKICGSLLYHNVIRIMASFHTPHTHHQDLMIKQPRIVIIGAGFGGIFCAKGLKGLEANITLLDRQNHHLFQPLLYQVATGFLGINDVAFPTRSMFLGQPNINVVMEEARGINTEARIVETGQHTYPYDYLIIATGSRYNFFGHDEWRSKTATLKTLDGAVKLRQRILVSFEQAELADDENERSRLLTYVVIGGGPTGVEMASAIADVVNYALEREFRYIKKEHVRIILLEAGPRILGAFDESLSRYAQRVLHKKGVHVCCNNAVQNIDDKIVMTPDHTIESEVVIWAAGVQATPVANWLGVAATRNGSVAVTENLSLPNHPEIFVLGDAASFLQDGKPLPALASVAKQQGKYLAKALKAEIAGKPYKPFHYSDFGTMATIGRDAAIMQLQQFKLSGWSAWMVWGVVHIMFLTGFRNRISVFITWVWTYLTYGLGARIIMHQENPDADKHPS
jgi:NADH dehydrogenase